VETDVREFPLVGSLAGAIAMATILEARDLYRFFHADDEETLALRGVSLRVEHGEMVAITGPSGSGKSTLLACIAGTDEPSGGEVRIFGERISRRPEPYRASIRARCLGFLQQSDNLIEHLSVEENVLLPMRLAGKEDKARLNELLGALGLVDQGRAYPEQLSGGEAARAGLAVALAAAPPILLADEPTGEVDAVTEGWILDLMERHYRNGGAVIVATHSVALASRAHRIVRLADGKVVEDE
jgi:putative ABC transport system ATP-binding protein